MSSKKFLDHNSNNERGVGIILLALILAVVMIATALVIDGNTALTSQRQLGIAAEQAAIAAVQRLMLRTRQVQRAVTEQGAAFEVGYKSILLETVQSAGKIIEASKVVGKTSGGQKLADLHLVLNECTEPWCNGTTATGATLEPGRWYRAEDGPPAPGHSVSECDEVTELPCFVPLKADDIVGEEPQPVIGANAFRVSAVLHTPLRYYFAEMFGFKGKRLFGSAIAWAGPTNAVFLLDLSPSIHQDTHLHRPPKDTALDELIPGTKTEFAFHLSSQSPVCEPFCPKTLLADPFTARFAEADDVERFVDSIETIDNQNGNSLPDVCTPVAGAVTNCPVFDNLVCTTDYCDWHGLNPNGCDLANRESHCQDHYQTLQVAVSNFETPTPSQETFAVDASADPGTGKVRGAQPLFSVLDGMHYAVKLFERRAKGDRIGLLAFDWELFTNSANNLSRIFLPSDQYQTLAAATDTQITGADAVDGSKTTPFSKFLFSRGLYFNDKEFYPLADLGDITDLKQPLIRAYEQLAALKTPNSRNFVMLFSDGRPNCVGDPSSQAVTERCLDAYDYWNQSLDELRTGPGSIQKYRDAGIPIHMVLYDTAMGNHTLNLTTDSAPTTSCMTDSIARSLNVPYVYDDCASQQLDDARDEVFWRAQELYGKLGACSSISISNTFYAFDEYMQSTHLPAAIALLLAPIALPGIYGQLMEMYDCCKQDRALPSCLAGVLTSFGCTDACCVLYRASSQLGASRSYLSTTFFGPNDKFYKIAVETNGLWSPLRERDPALPVGQSTTFAEASKPRLCTRVYPGSPDPFHGHVPQRQRFDPWGREKKTQIMDAIDAIVDEVPIMLVK